VGAAAGLALAAALIAVVATTPAALAHALLQSSDPVAGTTLSTVPTQVTIEFGEPPDPKLSSIKVLDTSGAPVTSGPAVAVAGQPAQLRVPLGPLAPGWYTVAWRTVSAVDGHAAAGSFAFGVAGPSGAISSAAPPGAPIGSAGPGGSSGAAAGAEVASSGGPSPIDIGGRFVLYVGLALLLGLALLGGVIAPLAGRPAAGAFVVAWVIAVLGASLVIVAELTDVGVDLGTALGTSIGGSILARAATSIAAGVGVLVLARWPARRGEGLGIIAASAAAAMLVDAANSHAAAGTYPILDIAVQWIHVAAVGLWIGGLAGLLVTVRGAPDERKARAARHFSRAAVVGIAVVAMSGLWRGIAEIGTFDALIGTDFGRLVIAKACLLAVLAGMGALNRWRSVPAASRTLEPLRRVGSVELLVGATALLLAAALVNVSPPAASAAGSGGTQAATSSPTPAPSVTPTATPSPLTATGHDFGTSVNLRLDVSPGSAGPNDLHVTVTDFDTGAPISPPGVTLRFVLPARSDVGESRLDLAPTGTPGMFAATGANLSLSGTWSITALVETSPPVEVPLQLTVPTPPLQVDVNRALGQPTLYTVHLSNGRTAQLYLDQWAATTADLHVTYFSAAGTELPVTGIMATVAAAGGTPGALPLSQLEPGHVVGHVRTTAGTPLTVEVMGTVPGGERLDFRLDITPGR
jgi:copper transport protein